MFKIVLLSIEKMLPISYYPLGGFAKKFRDFCAKQIVEQIGENVNVEKGAIIHETTKIGRNSGVGVNCVLSRNVTIGNNVLMGPECLIYTYNQHKFNPETLSYEDNDEIKPVNIQDNSWLGARCTILPGVTVGRGSTVAANSVVTKDVPEFCVVAGNPAKVVKKLLGD
ncbi:MULTISPECIES: acyltransferase [Bacillus cereus group]|uniref:acyltransferase n=1 Tax=Bacillus cereus group TaxID=86661 RepID=UPI0018F628B2|nr:MULTISPECIES: acyltransferase [Bacillus cereus group]MBJ7984635.1 acyltransferase [Bacillus cereus]